MSEADNTRRTALKVVTAIGTSCLVAFPPNELLAQQGEHDGNHALGGEASPHYVAPTIDPFSPKFFTAGEGLLVACLCDLIIPPTDTPGAAAAGVPHYIDQLVLQNAEQQKTFREGLAWMNGHGKPFIEMTEVEQIAILAPLSHAADAGKLDEEGVRFFHLLKGMTADGYYTSYAGLVQELGYKGNQALAKFEGCVHDEH